MLEKFPKPIPLGTVRVEALNVPTNWEIFSGEQELSISRIKVASVEKDTDLGGFDLTAAVKEHPDHLFVKVFAIKKDEVNDNGDAFSEDELKKAAETFIGVPIFCNHANDDIEKARGKVVHAWYDDDKGGIYIISMVDKVAYPKLARGIQEGYITGTSMGCQVHHSLCSICHNKAHVADEYCSHVKNQKTKKFSGKVKCQFHKSKCKPDEKCPICACEKGDEKEHVHKDAKVYEHNYGLKFIEDSFVVNPACHDCLVDCILNIPEYQKKAAQIIENYRKVASSIGQSQMMKVAGQAELQMLNKVLKYLEAVAKSMMDQKESVSMDYLSDVVDVMASTQEFTDELIEMGYGALPSPATLMNPDELGDSVNATAGLGQQTQANQMTPAPQPQQQQPSQPAGSASNSVGNGIGTVTKPTFSPTAERKIEELRKDGSNLDSKISSINRIIASISRIIDRYEPEAQASSNQVKESENNMEINTEKTAAGQALKPEHQQVTTEKQLADAKLDYAGNRQYKEINTTTEGDEQLGLSKEPVNDTTSDSPQVRKGDYANYTTELQLENDMKEAEVTRWNNYPEVITEKQWTDFNRAVGAILGEDQHNHTTEAQLIDLRKNHRWTEPNVTTENQLASDENWLETDNAWLNKGAAAAYAKALVTASVNALSDAIAHYKVTPAELVKAAKFITKDPQSQIKAAFLTLINGVPSKIEKRKASVNRMNYFSKVASGIFALDAVDALLASMGDHCKNLKAEDFVDAIRHVASSKMDAVEAKAQEKLASSTVSIADTTLDKTALFDEALSSLTAQPVSKTASSKDADGLYQVRAAIEEIDADINDQAAFIDAAFRFAQSQVNISDPVLYSIEVDDESGAVFTTLKEASKLTAEEAVLVEKLAAAQRQARRESLVREAQMGGEMGGAGGPGGGMAGGQGATMPAAPGGPGAGAPPMPPQESMDAGPGGADEAGEDDSQPSPPLSRCPLCGSKDVDVIAGKGKCNNPECGAEYNGKFMIEITKGKGIGDNQGDEKGEEGLGGEEDEGEGFAMPDDAAAPGGAPATPVAAMTRLTPGRLEKLASKENWTLGCYSPLTGSNNTVHVAKGVDKEGFPYDSHLCMDTGTVYTVHTRFDKNDPKVIWAEWRWLPKAASAGTQCSSCTRAKTAWTKALKTAGLTNEDFDALSHKKKAEVIVDMHEKGLFAVVKTASKNSSVVAEFKKAYTVTGTFPTESCREKLARRYGENALALSGPCKGQKIHDCVCSELKKAGVYADAIAFKVAETWKDKDACLECMEDYVRLGVDIEKAATVCQHMKVKYASPAELFAEELGDMHGGGGMGPGDGGNGGPGGPGGAPTDPELDSHDPFSGSPAGPAAPAATPSAPAAPAGGGGMGAATTGTDMGPLNDGMGGGMGIGNNPIKPPAPAGGMGGGMGGAGGMGGGSEHGTVMLEIPLSALDAIEQAIDAAHGEAPGAEPHHDLAGMDGGEEVGVELGGNVVDELEGAAETALDDATGTTPEENNEEGHELPGGEEVVEIGFSDEGTPDDSKEESGNPFDKGGEDDKGSDEKKDDSFGKSDDSNKEPEVSDNTEFKESDKLASYMRKGKQNRVGEINLDVASIQAALDKIAGETQPKVEGAQDVVDSYSAGDGSVQGNEKKFDADKPKVPRNNATMGKEPSDLNPQDKPLPDVAKASGKEGNLEGEENYEAESGVNLSGGTNGAGKSKTENTTSSSKKSVKVANEKKVGPAKPVSEDIEVEISFSDNKDLASTPESMKRKPFEESDSKEVKNVPERGKESLIQGEKDNLDVPKATEEFAPQIPMNGPRMSKEKIERYAPEKQDKIKGTVIATDEKSKTVEAEAVRIAGRMIEADLIDAKDLLKKIAELKQYQLPQLADIEKTIDKAISKTAQKGLATGPDGVEQPVPVIGAESNERGTDLTTAIRSLFSLDQRNKVASELTDANLRKTYGM